MKRRALLATSLSAPVLTGAAGCLDVLGDDSIYLGALRITNYAETALTVEVQVRRAGDLVHEEVIEDVPGTERTDDRSATFGSAFVSCGWPNDTADTFEIAVRHPDEDSWTETSADESDGDGACQFLEARVNSRDSITFFWDDCGPYEEERPDLMCAYGDEA